MTWTAPEVAELDELFVGGERELLDRWLQIQRSSLLLRCAGLPDEQLAQRPLPPSPLSLLGLVRHLADMERTWIRRRLRSEDVASIYPGRQALEDIRADTAERDYATLLAEWSAVDAGLAASDLEDTFEHPEYGPMSLRWIYQHVLREYAGHLGHADLIREQLDGRTFS